MNSKLNPYLNFDGNTREVMEFYKTVFGGELTMSTYAEIGGSTDPDEMNRIMHSMLVAENGITLMAADTNKHMDFKPGNNISISLSGNNNEELSGYFNKLSEGGTVVEPLTKAPWGDSFGMLIDAFGTQWMVNIAPAQL
jgi:PhnB protein